MTSKAPHLSLITGGAGYLAANLIRILAGSGKRVRRMYRPGKEVAPHPSPLVEDVMGDVRLRADLEKALHGVDTVYHLASQTSVYVANENPPADLEANAIPLLHILEISRSLPRPLTVIAAGTVTQTGIPERLPVDESSPDHPLTIYCMHKLLAEYYLGHYASKGWVKGAALRLANVYGPGPRSSSADRGILNAMMRKALKGEEIQIYGKGDYLRDYVYIEDVARAFALSAEHADAMEGRHFVLGSGKGHTLAEAIGMVVDVAAAKTGSRAPLRHIEPPGGLSPIESRNFVANPSALARAAGWSAEVGLAEGIGRTIDYYLQAKDIP